MAIEDYMPDFAVEAVYDLTVESLKRQGIKAVLVDLDNTLIAWNNPDGTPEMKKWLHDSPSPSPPCAGPPPGPRRARRSRGAGRLGRRCAWTVPGRGRFPAS